MERSPHAAGVGEHRASQLLRTAAILVLNSLVYVAVSAVRDRRHERSHDQAAANRQAWRELQAPDYQ